MHEIYLLLGSNLGDRETYLAKSRRLIEEKIGQIRAQSGLYETASWGKTDQPDYINQVVRVDSDLSPRQVLDTILHIEKKLGRERKGKWHSRVIDIDILFYEDMIVNEADLVIPHPFLHLRRFTLEPLAELAPDFKHPLLQSSIHELYAQLQDKLSVKRLSPI